MSIQDDEQSGHHMIRRTVKGTGGLCIPGTKMKNNLDATQCLLPSL